MKQEERDRYFKAVREWNEKHRIVGSEVQALVQESLDALTNFLEQRPPFTTLIDIGAGAGILGVPWLWLSPEHRAVFIEPAPKKGAFLHSFLAQEGWLQSKRAVVWPAELERVSRETFARDLQGPEAAFGVARAFSGSKSLEEAVHGSVLEQIPLYVFNLAQGKAELIKISPVELQSS